MKTNWVSVAVTLDDVLDNNKFIIPVFQRSIVWKEKKRKEFITSVRNGDPFGVILVHNNGYGKYELIDGLQRITTLRDYCNSKFDYVTEEDIDIALCEEIIKVKLRHEGLPEETKYITNRGAAIRSKIFELLRTGTQSYKIMNAIQLEVDLTNNDEVSDLVDRIIKKFEDSTDISGLSILAINYTGPTERIPDVFYNLNTGAVSLTKYETYAALWSKPLFKVDDKKLLDAVEEKYVQLQDDSELEVDYSQEDIIENGISLFEYCYGLGRLIRDKDRSFDILFGASNKSTDPIGFEVLALVLGESVNHADRLHVLLSNKNPQFLVEVKNVIIESIEHITEWLKPYLKAMNGSVLTSDSMYLIYHILISYIREYYDINVDLSSVKQRSDTLPQRDFKKYMPIHYLYDCMSEYWSLHRQVSDLDEDIKDPEKRHKYWFAIKTADWVNVTETFIESQKNVKTNIPQKNKLFLEYFMQLELKEHPEFNKFFRSTSVDDERHYVDIEHIVPKKVIAQKTKSLSVSARKAFPTSAIGNLCYLSSKDNRSKRDRTIYDYKEDRPSFAYNNDYLALIRYPDEESFDFLNLRTDEFCASYDSFIDKRQQDIKNEFIRLVKSYWV